MSKITSIANAEGWWVHESSQRVKVAAWGLLDDGRVVPLTVGSNAELYALNRLGDNRLVHEHEER